MEYNFIDILIYFITYSFLGWIMESIFRSVCEKKLINTGFLRGPFCPIYGIGAVIMILFLKNFSNNLILLFFISIIVFTIWEYLVGVLLEKLFHTKYWDYSDNKFNFQGRICLMNSIFWGILGVVFIQYIHPFIESIIEKVDITLLTFIYSIIGIVMLIDAITSIIKVKNIKVTLEKIEELNKEIKEKLKEITEERKTDILENIQNLVEQLKYKRNKTMLHLYKNVYRLKKAFPAIDTKEITEILNKKIELKEIKDKLKKKGKKILKKRYKNLPKYKLMYIIKKKHWRKRWYRKYIL